MLNRVQKGPAAEKTKKRLVKAGVELFDRYSFDGVSTRNLADRANVNLASIQYYFGSKEGLYLAVARYIVERVRSGIAPHITKIELTIAEKSPDKETCFRLLCDLLDRMLAHVLSGAEPKKWMGIFMREQIEPTAAFDILYKGVMEPVHGCFCRLIARILDLPPDSQHVKVTAYAISGSVFMFHMSRAEIGRSLGWITYNAGERETIKRVVFDHIRAVFGMPRDALQIQHGRAKMRGN